MPGLVPPCAGPPCLGARLKVKDRDGRDNPRRLWRLARPWRCDKPMSRRSIRLEVPHLEARARRDGLEGLAERAEIHGVATPAIRVDQIDRGAGVGAVALDPDQDTRMKRIGGHHGKWSV